ncbi:MAG: type II toxin-antitoxin system ParD family antitoxin [Pirellulales bacterium]|nr:type II toxin-antitoxin system ParD family antitoxin [Pirellulales bacterium]
MTEELSPELNRLIQEKLQQGLYQSASDLLVDAMFALEEIERCERDLRAAIQLRVAKAGQSLSQPFDREAFRAEARRRLGLAG